MSDLLSLCKELVEANNGHDPLDVNECIHRIRDLLAQHPSDPKHLPPRDCEVWFQDEKDRAEGKAPYWMEVRFEECDGDRDAEGCAHGHDDRWRIPYSDEILDVADVITWRELPEVE